MEDMATPELLGDSHFLQANDASGINPNFVGWVTQIHIRQALQLINQSPRLDELLNRLVKFDKRVNALSQQVERELASHENPDEQFHI